MLDWCDRRGVGYIVGIAKNARLNAAAKAQWRQVADQLRPKIANLANLMDEAEADVLVYMTFPKEHRT